MQEVPFRGPYGPYVFVCRGPSLSEHFCPILLLDITETANFRQIETKQWPKKQDLLQFMLCFLLASW